MYTTSSTQGGFNTDNPWQTERQTDRQTDRRFPVYKFLLYATDSVKYDRMCKKKKN